MATQVSVEDTLTPSTQLNATLRASVVDAFSTRRPVLTHLNADTSWLYSLPIPRKYVRNRIYYHILIDPWLRGSQSDVAKFFSQQWHKDPSALQTIVDLEDAIRGIEEVGLGNEKLAKPHTRERINGVEEKENWIDAVIVSHEFTDHMHKETLLEISPDVPIFATSKASALIHSWRHFSFVSEIPRFSGDWSTSPAYTPAYNHLPGWLGISRLAYAGQDLLYYHSAIMITCEPYEKSETANRLAECLLYTPHGITSRDIELLVSAEPRIETLALLHGLQDISLPKAQLNLGAHNGLKIQRMLRTKYWISTHDEVKTGGGIISWFLNRKMITLEEAIEQEKAENGNTLDDTILEGVSDVRFVEIGNGESFILE